MGAILAFDSSLSLSEKLGSISDRNEASVYMQGIDEKMLSRIYGTGRGAVVSPNAFLDLGSRDAVDKALSRLAASGTIRRLAPPSGRVAELQDDYTAMREMYMTQPLPFAEVLGTLADLEQTINGEGR